MPANDRVVINISTAPSMLHDTATHGVSRDGERQRPIVIAHRGASGYRPEHTLEAYRLALRQGADFIEPDLVATRDGVLVARHDNELSTTTDVGAHPEFASRHATKTVDGTPVTGWFSEDFTLAEIKTLRCRERLPGLRPANTRFDGLYPIPTFAEVLQLASRASRDGRVVGVYPETKYPTYFAREGRRIDGGLIAFSPGAALVATLLSEGFTDPHRVYIQSFEIENLLELKTRLMPAAGIELPLVQLFGRLDADGPYDIGHNLRAGVDLADVYGGLVAQVVGGLEADTRWAALASGPVLRWMRASYAAGVGPWKGDLLPGAAAHSPRATGRVPCPETCTETASHGLTAAHPMLAHALQAGLQVHPYTLRAEPEFLTRTPAGVTGSVIDEAVQLFRLGVQGVFIDQPDLGVAALEVFLRPSPAAR